MVKNGLDVLIAKKLKLVKGRKVGIITNPSGVSVGLEQNVDLLLNAGVKVTAIYSPEHGFRGAAKEGEKIESYTDAKTGLPVYSLYGANQKPSATILKNVDVIIYDLQDAGARFYTFISTLLNALAAVKEAGKSLLVLDRPNPINGHLVEGPVLDANFSSFIGLYPIPIVHGLTVGELAQLFNQEFNIQCELRIIPLKDWKRSMSFSDTKLPWVATSPHLPQSTTAWHYATTGFIGELHTICIGVGYTLPFEIVGACWIDGEKLAKELNRQTLPGVKFRPITFRPYYYIFKDQVCQGVQVHITKLKDFSPVTTGLHILATIYNMYPEQVIFPADLDNSGSRLRMFYQAMGSDSVHKMLIQGKSAAEIIDSWQEDLERFKKVREQYLIY